MFVLDRGRPPRPGRRNVPPRSSSGVFSAADILRHVAGTKPFSVGSCHNTDSSEERNKANLEPFESVRHIWAFGVVKGEVFGCETLTNGVWDVSRALGPDNDAGDTGAKGVGVRIGSEKDEVGLWSGASRGCCAIPA